MTEEIQEAFPVQLFKVSGAWDSLFAIATFKDSGNPIALNIFSPSYLLTFFSMLLSLSST